MGLVSCLNQGDWCPAWVKKSSWVRSLRRCEEEDSIGVLSDLIDKYIRDLLPTEILTRRCRDWLNWVNKSCVFLRSDYLWFVSVIVIDAWLVFGKNPAKRKFDIHTNSPPPPLGVHLIQHS